jgi:hypothetical protein
MDQIIDRRALRVLVDSHAPQAGDLAGFVRKEIAEHRQLLFRKATDLGRPGDGVLRDRSPELLEGDCLAFERLRIPRPSEMAVFLDEVPIPRIPLQQLMRDAIGNRQIGLRLHQ